MEQHYWIGLTLLLVCVVLEVSSRPSDIESPSSEDQFETTTELLTDDTALNRDKRYRPFSFNTEFNNEPQDETAKEILDKIKTVNQGLKKPNQRHKINYYKTEPYTGGGYTIDSDTLEKLKQIIASGKLHNYKETEKNESDILNDESEGEKLDKEARALFYPAEENKDDLALGQVPYITNIPVLFMPPAYNPMNNDLNTLDVKGNTLLRQTPSLPFRVPWPLAPFFPILIKDPLLGFIHGGGWNNFVQYGQEADICKRQQKAMNEQIEEESDVNNDQDFNSELNINLTPELNYREGRALKKRNIQKSANLQQIDNSSKNKKSFLKPQTTKKPLKAPEEEPDQDTKTIFNRDELKGPFLSFFGNKQQVPSPGFIINKLKVRRGGVAIAGPGGVATAGRGGTAIVGPGGLAYTQPGGLAVAGPAARVVAVSADADLSSIVSRLREQANIDSSVPRLLEAIPEAKIVATGPIIYFHPRDL